ncbi:hypothetical protein P3L51_18040 [Streptomyces sp. PSRA5]|uniref:hypothetical protein n=1 Tax=Streptomyces panacea TaxID=3035064 RepID=UPI00339CF645
MRSTYRAVAAAAVLVIALTACGSEPEGTAIEKSGTVGKDPLTPEETADIAADLGYPAEPDAAQRAAFMRALDTIDPDLAHGKEDIAVSRAMDTCRSLKDYPGDTAKQEEVAMKRWTSPAHPEGRTNAVAANVVKAAHTNICPDF